MMETSLWAYQASANLVMLVGTVTSLPAMSVTTWVSAASAACSARPVLTPRMLAPARATAAAPATWTKLRRVRPSLVMSFAM